MIAPAFTAGWLPLAKAAEAIGWSRSKLFRSYQNGEIPDWAFAQYSGHVHFSGLWCAGFKSPPAVFLSQQPTPSQEDAHVFTSERHSDA